MTTIFTHTCCQATSPLIDCSINDVLFQIVPDGHEPLTKFTSVLNSILVHALVHNGPDGVIDRIKVRRIGWPHLWPDEVWCIASQILNCFASPMRRSRILLKDEHVARNVAHCVVRGRFSSFEICLVDICVLDLPSWL